MKNPYLNYRLQLLEIFGEIGEALDYLDKAEHDSQGGPHEIEELKASAERLITASTMSKELANRLIPPQTPSHRD